MHAKNILRICLSLFFTSLLLPMAASATQTLIYSDHEPLGGDAHPVY